MISLGTIFTIAVIGTAVAGIYAISRNTQQIGSAFTRGAENLVSAPLNNYLNSLFTNLPTLTSIPKPQETNPLPLSQPSAGLPNPANAPTNPTSIDVGLSQGIKPTPTQTISDPNLSLDKFQPKTYGKGFYYINYAGSKYDTQWELTGNQASQIAEGAKIKGDSLLGIKYLGTRKLGTAGFNLIGKANNYL